MYDYDAAGMLSIMKVVGKRDIQTRVHTRGVVAILDLGERFRKCGFPHRMAKGRTK